MTERRSRADPSISQQPMRQERKKKDFEITMKRLGKLQYGARNWEILYGNRQDLLARYKEAMEVSQILKDEKTQSAIEHLPPKSQSVTKMLVYLGLVESLGAALIDMALMLLIANEREVHTRGAYTRHVTKLKELRDIDLAYKLEFIESDALPSFTGLIDRNLRNAIAHLNFRIDGNGTIRHLDGNKVEIDEITSRFWTTVTEILMMFEMNEFMDFLRKGEQES